MAVIKLEDEMPEIALKKGKRQSRLKVVDVSESKLRLCVERNINILLTF